MKLLLVAVFIGAIFATACSSTPPDLYDCVEDADCILMHKNLKKDECCVWDSINREYEEWYEKEVESKALCNYICHEVKTTCHNNKCVLTDTRGLLLK
ncbi:MAG: hypothetical protein ABIA93_00720 [Candidatus Woesearchaeota archaeon]